MDLETCLLQHPASSLERRGDILGVGPKGLFYSVWGEQVIPSKQADHVSSVCTKLVRSGPPKAAFRKVSGGCSCLVNSNTTSEGAANNSPKAQMFSAVGSDSSLGVRCGHQRSRSSTPLMALKNCLSSGRLRKEQQKLGIKRVSPPSASARSI